MVGYALISILLGLIPEVLFITLFLIYTKNIKTRKFLLSILISIIYPSCFIFRNFKIIYYLIFIIVIYVILKLLYKEKTQIIDIFIISLAITYTYLLSYVCFYMMKIFNFNYCIVYLIDRVILFMPFIFKDKFNKFYKKYCKFWNRNDDEKRPIKSITLRNISLIMLNIAMFVLNVAILDIK